MGYNTAILMLNDGQHDLENEVEVGKKISQAMSLSQRPEYREKGVNVGLCGFANPMTVMSAEHADDVQVLAVGGNSIIRLGTLYGDWSYMLDKEALLKRLADQMGYRVVKKPKALQR